MKATALAILVTLFVGGTALAAVTPKPPWSGLPNRTSAKPHSVPGDPVNIAFEGSRAQVLAAFAGIGWKKADPLSVKDDAHLAEAATRHGSYLTAPVSNLYLFGRAEDFAVEHELGWVGKRDHARFWDTGKQDSATHKEVWIGDCSRDIRIKIIRRGRFKVGTTHVIDGHLDTERDGAIVNPMKSKNLVQTVIMEPGMGKVSNLKNSTGDTLYTDGKVALVVLK